MEKEKRPSLIKRISRKFSGTPKPKLTEEEIEFLVSHTQLSREKIEASYKQFLRSHPSAVMDLKRCLNQNIYFGKGNTSLDFAS